MTNENNDGLNALSEVLAIRRSGYHRHVHSETGAVVIFPATAKHEYEWERRALEMHNAQVPVIPDAKPEENTLATRMQVIRGD